MVSISLKGLAQAKQQSGSGLANPGALLARANSRGSGKMNKLSILVGGVAIGYLIGISAVYLFGQDVAIVGAIPFAVVVYLSEKHGWGLK